MATLGHIAVGMAAARLQRPRPRNRAALAGAMLMWSLLSLLPDADLIGFNYGVRYADPWGHRGATHSLSFALGLGVALAAVVRRYRMPLMRTAALASLVLASHPLLDIWTDGGLGCALLWPVDPTRYFAPWRPIPVAPIGWAFISPRGVFVLLFEALTFLPLFAYSLWPRRAKGNQSPQSAHTSSPGSPPCNT